MHFPRNIKAQLVSAVLIALLAVGLIRYFGRTKEQKLEDSMTPAHKQALAYAARASSASLKDHEAAIGYYRLAIAAEPDSREWQEGLAFEMWQAKRTSEAIPMWTRLAHGTDQIAINSAKMLAMPPAHRQALLYAANASALSTKKDYDGAISGYRLAMKEEPESRRWQEGLAVELWQAKRISEAVQIWKRLASGNDDIAKQAAKWQSKVAREEAMKP